MKIGAIIQARMGSTRLSGKVMKEIQGKTILQHVIERVGQSKLIDEIIIATTVHGRDDAIVEEAKKCGVKSFRGSETDVLGRYYHSAKENGVDLIIRITSDCPLIDPVVTDEIIKGYLNGGYDIATNAGSDLSQRTFPRGLDTEVFSFECLERAFKSAKEVYQREHVTPYIYENSKNILFYKNDIDYSRYRWTLDTEEDFDVISRIYDSLYTGKHDFYLDQIVELFNKEPELYNINAHIAQKKV